MWHILLFNFWSSFYQLLFRYLLFGVYFSPHRINIYVNTNSKGNQSWNKNKRNIHFHLFLIVMLKNLLFFFNIKIPYQQFLTFLSFDLTSDTNATLSIRMRHKCDTSAIRTTRVRHKWKILILITTRVKTYFRTLIFTIWQVKDHKERNNFILRTTIWKLLVSTSKCV